MIRITGRKVGPPNAFLFSILMKVLYVTEVQLSSVPPISTEGGGTMWDVSLYYVAVLMCAELKVVVPDESVALAVFAVVSDS